MDTKKSGSQLVWFDKQWRRRCRYAQHAGCKRLNVPGFCYLQDLRECNKTKTFYWHRGHKIYFDQCDKTTDNYICIFSEESFTLQEKRK